MQWEGASNVPAWDMMEDPMKRVIWVLVLVGALVLGVQAATACPGSGKGGGPGVGRGPGPGMGLHGFGPGPCMVLRDPAMQLTDKQKASVGDYCRQHRDVMQAVFHGLHSLRDQVKAEVLKDQPDWGRVEALNAQVAARLTELARAFVETRDALGAMLDAGQKARFLDTLANPPEPPSHGRGMGAGQGQGCAGDCPFADDQDAPPIEP
jgi:Spy/CpxP family protein refolding chaperone